MTQLDSRTVSEVLPCILTDEEQRERGRQLADALRSVSQEEDSQKITKDQMKERLAALVAEVSRLTTIVHDGREDRSVQVRIDYDESRSLVHKTRLDTGELTHSRAMTDDEKQRILPFASRKAN